MGALRDRREPADECEDPATVILAARGADAAFAMGTPCEAGPDAELREGKMLIEALEGSAALG